MGIMVVYGVKVKFKYIFKMRRNTFTLNEVVSLVEEMIDNEKINEGTIDIVELPPEKIDEISDCAAIDDENLGQQVSLGNTVGNLEIHISEDGEASKNKRKENQLTNRRKFETKWLRDADNPICEIDIQYENKNVMEYIEVKLDNKDPREIFAFTWLLRQKDILVIIMKLLLVLQMI